MSLCQKNNNRNIQKERRTLEIFIKEANEFISLWCGTSKYKQIPVDYGSSQNFKQLYLLQFPMNFSNFSLIRTQLTADQRKPLEKLCVPARVGRNENGERETENDELCNELCKCAITASQLSLAKWRKNHRDHREKLRRVSLEHFLVSIEQTWFSSSRLFDLFEWGKVLNSSELFRTLSVIFADDCRSTRTVPVQRPRSSHGDLPSFSLAE